MDTEQVLPNFEKLEEIVRGYMLEAILAWKQIHSWTDDDVMTTGQFVAHIVFLLYKDYYLEHAQQKRFGEHYTSQNIKEDADSPRRSFDRAMSAMHERKEQDIERLGHRADYINRVTSKEKRGTEVSGNYHYSDIDAKAISEYSLSLQRNRLVSLLSSGRIVDSKEVRGRDISYAYYEYVKSVHDASQAKSSREWIENLLDISNLESQCAPAFLYSVAKYMNDKNEEKIPPQIGILYSLVLISADTAVESRFLHNRNSLIEKFFDEKQVDAVTQRIRLLLLFQTYICANAGRSLKVQSILKRLSTDDAKKYFEEKYNLFEDYSFGELQKEDSWNPKLVKKYRYVVGELTDDGYRVKCALNSLKQYKNRKIVPRSE